MQRPVPSATWQHACVSLDALLGFAALCLLLELTPGPNTFLVLRHSLHGARTGALTALGSAAGALVWAVAVAVGLAALLEQSADAYRLLKILGGLYLVHLGARAFHSSRRAPNRHGLGATPGTLSTPGVHDASTPAADTSTGSAPVVRASAAFGAGLLSCVLNPKVGLFFLAVVPQFVPAGSGVRGALLLGVIEAGVALSYLLVLAALAARAVTWLRRPAVTRALERTSAAVLTAFGVGTIATAR